MQYARAADAAECTGCEDILFRLRHAVERPLGSIGFQPVFWTTLDPTALTHIQRGVAEKDVLAASALCGIRGPCVLHFALGPLRWS